ncbi:MAG: hypothetical protein K6U74_13015 [Firmicutes bacterium]|nr:hypothetical protein [Bacillota bacterium]
MKIVVVDLPDCEQPNLRFSLENGYPERPELWVNSTLAASPEELQKVLRRAEEEWRGIGKGVEEREKRDAEFLAGLDDLIRKAKREGREDGRSNFAN